MRASRQAEINAAFMLGYIADRNNGFAIADSGPSVEDLILCVKRPM
jgi:hypothetical protein